MSLKELLENQRHNVKRLKVNVIEEVRKGLYIIEDDSTAALFEAIEEHCQLIEVNKALDIAQPVAKSRNTIKLKNHLNTFRKTKKFDIKNNHEKLIEELGNVAKKEERVKVNETPKYENNVISYEDSIRGSTWKKERGWADKILLAVKRRHLKLNLDDLTRGDGNCFMTSVLQQLRRKTLFQKIPADLQDIVKKIDHQSFRSMVKNFVEKSKTSEVKEIKEMYNMAETKPWRKYCS